MFPKGIQQEKLASASDRIYLLAKSRNGLPKGSHDGNPRTLLDE